MRLDASQHLRLDQQLKLSPRIIQAMEILQLPIMVLQERIDAEMQANPVLEMHDPGVDDEAPMQKDDEVDSAERPLVVREDTGHSEDFQRLSDFEDQYEPSMIRSDAPPRPAPLGDRDRKMDAMANAPAPQQSLDEYLSDQWAFIEAPPALKAVGLEIINHVDDDGYLRVSLDELAKGVEPPADLAATIQALQLVQTLDPVGVAARDLKECLLLQLRAEEAAGRDVSLEKLLVERHLRDIEMNRLPQIAARTGKTIEQIKQALVSISHLNPRPGNLVGQRSAPVISPDVTVDFDDRGELVVSMPEGNTPQLYISKSYRKLAKDRSANRDARLFLQKNIRSAQWLIGAIQQRRETVRRVAVEVFKAQREFLLAGPEALRPLPMADVAGKVGVHVATVSRAVAGKHVQTPRGIFPLRMFFSGGKTTTAGEDMAWDAIKVKLQELIAAEDKAKPLNDGQLAKEIAKHGITVARRTVAKYRDLLEIPPARKRRQY